LWKNCAFEGRSFPSLLLRMSAVCPLTKQYMKQVNQGQEKMVFLQRWGTAHTLPKYLCCSIYIVCFVSFYVLFVYKYVLNYCHQVATQ
jgi:hypothetical protein